LALLGICLKPLWDQLASFGGSFLPHLGKCSVPLVGGGAAEEITLVICPGDSPEWRSTIFQANKLWRLAGSLRVLVEDLKSSVAPRISGRSSHLPESSREALVSQKPKGLRASGEILGTGGVGTSWGLPGFPRKSKPPKTQVLTMACHLSGPAARHPFFFVFQSSLR
jgi:hypothetical protein